jgi:putative inorganic carbon (hco3(-)) transporter
MKPLHDFKNYFLECKSENFGFYCVAGYIIFSYMRPHVIFPELQIIPWTQLFIMAGLVYAATKSILKFQTTHFSVLMFGLSTGLSTIYSFNQDTSLKNLSTVFVWMLEVLFFTSCVRTEKQLRLVVILFFLVLFKISFFGAKTWVLRGFAFKDYGIAGPNGFFENSGELSLIMAMLVIMSMSVIHQNPKISKLYYFLPITALMTVLAASSRASQLGLVVGLFLFFILRGQFKFKYLLIGGLFCYSAYQLLPEGQKKRFESAGTDSTSVSRLTYWKGGVEMFYEHPILGIGYRCFPEYFHQYYRHLIPAGQSWGKRLEVAHNTLVEVGSEQGLVGLITYLAMYFYSFKLNGSSRRMMRQLKTDEGYNWKYQFSVGLDISNAVFIIGAFFMSVAFYPYNYLMLMLSGSLNNIIKSQVAAVIHRDRTNAPT